MGQNVLKALEIMGYGVLAIFIVIAILIAMVFLMKAADKKHSEDMLSPDYKPAGEKIKQRFILGKEVLSALLTREKKDDSAPDTNEETKKQD